LSAHRRKRFVLLWGLLFFLRFATGALADAYDPPPTYYNAATGTGATLMQQLDNIMTAGQSLQTYGDARFLLDDTDEDPNNPSNVLLFYNRMSVSEVWNPNSNQFGTREHVWPSSRRPDGTPSNTTRNIGSDLHILKPLDASTNSSRGNDAFGTPTASGSNGHTGSYYYPGDADRGDTARIIFYGGTRWKDEGLKVVNGSGNPSNFEMGDLAALIVWHFADPPDTFERRRNQMIYGYQGNRNAFIDRPEYVWSVYMNQTNDSQITIAGGTPVGDGGSARNVDLGRVFVGGAVPSAQNFTLNKAGSTALIIKLLRPERRVAR
jgi:endonuclease I